MRWSRRGLAALVAVLVVMPVTADRAAAAGLPASACARSLSTEDLTSFFSSGASGLLGGDYPRSIPLSDGRVLWLFQDSFIGDPATANLTAAGFAHNVALVQTGLCFTVRWGGGDLVAPRSFMGGAQETDLIHWFWPMDGEVGADGNVHVFVAEFWNPEGTGAATGARPTAVWRAVLRQSDLAVLSFAPAPDAAALPLYGFTVVSDDDWSYLYGNCYRQFTNPGYLGAFDTSCNTDVTVARVPHGHFEQVPTYWNGSTWGTGRAAASVIHHDGVLANPLQVERWTKNRYVAVALLDDWFGRSVQLYEAHSPTGPFERYGAAPLSTQCGDTCTVYFATFTPWRTAQGDLQLSISNFTWDKNVAFQQPRLYRPTLVSVAAPPTEGDEAYTFTPDGTMELQVAGRFGVDPGAAAVVMSVTATGAFVNTHVTVWACGQPRPRASNLNVTRGVPVSNTVISAIGVRGRVCLWSYEHLELEVDVQGWMAPGGDFRAVTPARLLDSRPGTATVDGKYAAIGLRPGGSIVEVPVAGRGGVPATARQVAVNVVGMNAAAGGHVTVWQCGAVPGTSNLNVPIGRTVANLAIVTLSAKGTMCLKVSHPMHVLFDVEGWWGVAQEVRLAGPSRLFDSRPTAVTIDGLGRTKAALAPGVKVSFPVAGRGGVGAGDAVALDVVAVSPTGEGALTVWACSATQPSAPTVRFGPVANQATLLLPALGADGAICMFATGASLHVVVDAMAWVPVAAGGYTPSAASRLMDTRA
ncbi:MAG: hypothetical protein RL238_1088 [Actinomycetota bacterium]